MQKDYKNSVILKRNKSKWRERRKMHQRQSIRILLCAHARTRDRVPQLRECGKLSLDTLYKFSCDYSYIWSFYRHVRIIKFLVWTLVLAWTRVSAAYRVLQLREGVPMALVTFHEFLYDYLYISIFYGHANPGILLFWDLHSLARAHVRRTEFCDKGKVA